MPFDRHRTPRRTGLHGRLISLLAAALLALPAAGQTGDRKAIDALVQEGRHREALVRLEEHLRANPDDAQARFLRGIALAETGRTDEAIAVFSRLAEERPELPEPHNNLAVLHATRGEYDEARDALLAAIDASPENARYRENLGDLYANMAIEAYGRAARLGEQGGRAAAKLELLRELLEGRGGADASDAPAPPDAAACAGAVDTLHGWAEAWTSQDVERYLGYYSDAFSPPGGVSRELWEAERRRRLGRRLFIEVSVADPEVEVCADRRARLTFTQSYRSDMFRDRVRKELWLSRTGDGWTILSERSLEDDRSAPASAEPSTPPAATAATDAAPVGPGASSATVYRVQLASHRERQQAVRDLREAVAAHPSLLGGLPVRIERTELGARGVWHRIQLGEFGEASEAQTLCRRLEDRGQACLAVATGSDKP